ncbi:hypothetical protein D3C80_1761490 [compost metagenome]
MRDNVLYDFMQPQNRVAPRHRAFVAFIAFDFLKVGLGPAEGIVLVPLGKPYIVKTVSIQCVECDGLAPVRIGMFKFLNHEGKYAIQKTFFARCDFVFNGLFGREG